MFAPCHDWALYENRVAAADAAWLRSLSSQERFALYADLFDMVLMARHNEQNQERLDRWTWQQKLASRMKMVEAFRKLDEHRRSKDSSSS
jgi:hypothetical protein